MTKIKKSSGFKLRKLKELKIKNLERNLLDILLKGQDHYVFINDRNKAQVVFKDGNWVSEHIRTAILKHNYEIDKVSQMWIKDFTDEEVIEYENKYLK